MCTDNRVGNSGKLDRRQDLRIKAIGPKRQLNSEETLLMLEEIGSGWIREEIERR